MAAILRSSSPVPQNQPAPQPRSGDAPPLLARAYLLRLSALHDEAAKTAFLANLVGRAPMALAALAAATSAVAVGVGIGATGARMTVWLALVFIGIVAGSRAYMKAMRAPFELDTLEGFARDLSATFVYAGFAWGAGAFLVLPANSSLLVLLAFGVGGPALLASILRVRDMSLCFLAPAVALPAFAAILRPFGGGLADMAALSIAGVAVAAAVQVAERLAVRPQVPDLDALPAR